MKTQSSAFRTSDWAEGSPSNRTMDLNTQQEWLKGNSVNVLEWPGHSLGLNPVKYFWRNLKMCICPHPTWQSLGRQEMRRRMADNCKCWWEKLVTSNKQKILEAVKVLQLNIYLCNALISVFLFLINLWICDNSVFALSIWCMECRLMWKKRNLKQFNIRQQHNKIWKK